MSQGAALSPPLGTSGSLGRACQIAHRACLGAGWWHQPPEGSQESEGGVLIAQGQPGTESPAEVTPSLSAQASMQQSPLWGPRIPSPEEGGWVCV